MDYRRVDYIKESYIDRLAISGGSLPEDVQRFTRDLNSCLFDSDTRIGLLVSESDAYGPDVRQRFRAYRGESARTYMFRHRISLAKELLKVDNAADLSLLRVALEVGFNSHQAFTMCFKRHEGCSPSEWMKNVK